MTIGERRLAQMIINLKIHFRNILIGDLAMLATKTRTQDLTIGTNVTLYYPRKGYTNILKRRTGEIVNLGPNWFTLELKDGSYRTFSSNRCVDLRVIE